MEFDQPPTVGHSCPGPTFQVPHAAHRGEVHAIVVRKLPTLVGLGKGSDAGGHSTVVEAFLVFQLRPEPGNLLGAGHPGGNRGPIDVCQSMVGNDAVLGVDVLGKPILHPETALEMGTDPIRELPIPPRCLRLAGQGVQRGRTPKRIDGMALRHPVVFNPRGPLDVVTRPSDCAIVRGQRSQKSAARLMEGNCSSSQ